MDPVTAKLIRRRSFAIPGKATRMQSLDGPGSVKMKLRLGKRHTFQFDHAPFGHRDRERMTAPWLEPHRVQTPSEMEYSHLGALKRGSLFVTNGAASPDPSVKSRVLTPEKLPSLGPSDEDYFTASEGHTTGDEFDGQVMLQQRRRNQHRRRASSPLKQDISINSGLTQRLERSSTSPSARFQSSVGGTSFVDGYRSEISSDSFSGSPKYERVATPQQENSLADDPETCNEPNGEVMLGYDNSAHHHSRDDEPSSAPSTSLITEEGSNRELNRGDSGKSTETNADSGYASGGSILGVADSKSRNKDYFEYQKSISNRLNDQHSWRPDREESLAQADAIHQMTEHPGIPADYAVQPNHSASPEDDIIESIEHGYEPLRLHRPSVLRSASWKKAFRKSYRISAEPAPTVAVEAKREQGNQPSVPKQKILQKARSQVLEPTNLHLGHDYSRDAIPSVPKEVRASFARRLSASPGMGFLCRTYDSTAHTDVHEIRRSASPFNMPIRFPSPSPSVESGYDMREDIPEPPDRPPHRYLGRMLSVKAEKLMRRKSYGAVERRRSNRLSSMETEYADVADFGTVAHSLGASPYDVASLPPAARNHPRPLASHPTHPHQLGSAMARPRSMVEMNARVASEFARLRSRERAAPIGRNANRPRSFHDAGAHSSVGSSYYAQDPTPPVPPLPGPYSCGNDMYPKTNLAVPKGNTHVASQYRPSGRPSPSRLWSPNPWVVPHDAHLPTSVAGHSKRPHPPAEAHILPSWDQHSEHRQQYRKHLPSTRHPTRSPLPSPSLSSEGAAFEPYPSRRRSHHEDSRHVIPPTLSGGTHKATLSPYDERSDRRNPDARSRARSRARSPKPGSMERAPSLSPHGFGMADRYSGGLDYGYEPGYGVGGSAGTRGSPGVSEASRKSRGYMQDYGVDLSDVPVAIYYGGR
ncbi:hypothetical protein P152DRAFT_456216 [Eremomyces bilateralis CBS 781.70]|uniref:Uncharacterized protein n=1 Tax=Eremomyces bilateralis CBS 781.70 TaxID=1392243 RepID=A0A6G1GB81_9PEZI|nr:uncharacterized protein P152DRAFT_456216 [Eremomyces bilateralis CBS 781.70]KAF1815161.1 hypothetical protein P152DRAFT_456216 [Eremomyces bilateralis CBS 781.70]